MTRLRSILPLVLVGLLGCGSGVKVVPISGIVTKNGKPLANASMVFIPDPSNAHQTPGTAESGPEGNYQAKQESGLGLSFGKYLVVVTPEVELPPGFKIPEGFEDDPYQAQLAAGIGVAGSKVPSQTAEMKNEFSIQVTEEKGDYDFDVKAPSRAKTKS
ncbi:carboxypeptidase regulatory-like domain-containing protein [Singulisphaera sp. Ch08]|uniref:Carboxypeptidase regulatory-like domain-containing protein n=1 Tax=Singulisphaera sp. Ch08 TaxID=3120278 RepID=A0AAU7CI54_9BACT